MSRPFRRQTKVDLAEALADLAEDLELMAGKEKEPVKREHKTPRDLSHLGSPFQHEAWVDGKG